MASSLLAWNYSGPFIRDEAEGDEQLLALVAQEESGELAGRDGVLRAGDDAQILHDGVIERAVQVNPPHFRHVGGRVGHEADLRVARLDELEGDADRFRLDELRCNRSE